MFGLTLLLLGIHVFGPAINFSSNDWLSRGSTAPWHFMKMIDNVVFLILMLITLPAEEFGGYGSHGTAKNAVSRGISREQFYLSKVFGLWLFTAMFYIIFIVVGTVGISITNGFNGNFNLSWLQEVATKGAFQLLVLLALTSVGVCIGFITKNTTWTVGIASALVFGPSFVIAYLTYKNEAFARLNDFELHNLLVSVVTPGKDIGFTQGFTVLTVSVVVIVVSSMIGMWWFKKRDVA